MNPKTIDTFELLASFKGIDETIITNLKEDWPAFCRYVSCLERLKEDQSAFERFSTNIKQLFGEPNLEFNLNKYLQSQDAKMNESRADKIIKILKEAGKPLKSKDIKIIYINMRMEEGAPLQLKRGVQSTLAHLKKYGKINVDENNKYYLIDESQSQEQTETIRDKDEANKSNEVKQETDRPKLLVRRKPLEKTKEESKDE